MGTTKAYDDLVEGFRAKISGNIESKVMTPEETAKEIAEVTEGVFSGADTRNASDGKTDVPIVQEPKRRGRPKGSKNKPKVK